MQINLSTNFKQTLTTTQMKSFAMKISLFEQMFYYNTNGQICARLNQSPKPENFLNKGLVLPHNIIVLDETLYLPGETAYRELNKKLDNDWEIFCEYGFDISIPWFDQRSKPAFLTQDNITDFVPLQSNANFNTLVNGQQGLLTQSYLNNTDYYQKFNKIGIKIWDKDAMMKPVNSYDFFVRSVMSEQYQQNLTTPPDQFSAYQDPWHIALDSDYLNYNTNDKKDSIDIFLCGEDYSFKNKYLSQKDNLRAFNGIALNPFSSRVWENFIQYFTPKSSKLIDRNALSSYFSIQTTGEVQNLDPLLEFLLKNCFIWFKCAFYADYIDYKDFNQVLNQEADVKFHNVMVTKTGNFDRYEEYYSKGEISARDLARQTRPYFPSTTPSVDFVRPYLFTSDKLSGDFDDNMQAIIEDVNRPDSLVGQLPIEPFEGTSSTEFFKGGTSPDSTLKDARPDYLPPIWMDPESRKEAVDYVNYPIMFPKDGNILTGGRIISPTIDELWYVIKTLMGGRKQDAEQSTEEEPGYPRGEQGTQKFNESDTRPQIMEHLFKNGQNWNAKLGDPVNIDYYLEGSENTHYTVTQWINNPNKIEYKNIKELKEMSELVATGINASKIENITQPELYSASQNPKSLRELEGIIKGLRWNLALFIKFMEVNGAYIGALGRPNTGGGTYNTIAGSIYMLHKDYNAAHDWNSPETIYDERINRQVADIRGRGVYNLTDDKFGPNQNYIPPEWIFLNAAGTYTALNQNANIPVREDEVW